MHRIPKKAQPTGNGGADQPVRPEEERVMRSIWGALVVFALAATPAIGSADTWSESADGVCDRHWSAGSLARGPMGMTNALTLPFRTLWGGVTEDLMSAALVPLSFSVSLAEGSQLLAAGVLETASGGVLGLVPDTATELELDPVVRVPIRERSFPYRAGSECPPVHS